MTPDVSVPTVTSEPPTPKPKTRVEEVPGPERTVTLTVPEVVGLSIGLILLGLALGLAGLFLAYYAGAKESERRAAAAWKKLRRELF